MQKVNKEKWDKKTQTFPRYNPKNNEFQDNIIKILEKNKYLDKNFSLLDVGCGTGIFTITLAKSVDKVLGIDISDKMLEILNEDACTHGVKNISTSLSTLEQFETKEKYDLVFASRTPALEEEKDYIKFSSLSKKFVAYLGFAGLKKSNVQRELKKRYSHLEFREFNETKDIKNWLEKSSKKYTSYIFEEKFSRTIDEELALKYINEYLSNTQMSLEKNEIEDIVKSLRTDDNKLVYELDTKMELLLWEN